MATSCLQKPTQYLLDIALPKFATFDTFVDACDGQLSSALQQLTQTLPTALDETQQFFLWGVANTGKTHLLQAICNQSALTQQKSVYLPMRELEKLDANILEEMHQFDIVCIDDVEIVLGRKQWDRALFNLINELRAENKNLVITSSYNPNDIKVSFNDLASRLVWGQVYKLNLLSDDEKAMAIQLHAKARGLEVSQEVCSYLLKRYPRELDKLIGFLDELDKQSMIQQRKVTVPFVKAVLQDN